MRTIEQILDIVCEFLNKNSIDYVIVGGFAVLFYGNPRTTLDIRLKIKKLCSGLISKEFTAKWMKGR